MRPDLVSDLRQLIARLSLVSHASAARLDSEPRSADGDIGGNRPPGGIDARDDKAEGFGLKSAVYFERRFARIHTDIQLQALVLEAERALEAWQRTPFVEGQRPALQDPRWKQWIAHSRLDGGELARLYGVSRQYIHEVRKKYRDAA